MKNKEYHFLVEGDEFYSFLSFCEVNKIIINPDNYLPFIKDSFILKGNEVKVIKLSDDYCYDWYDFVEEYYTDLFCGMSIKEVVNKLKSDRYSFDGSHFRYGKFLLDPEWALGCLDDIDYDLLEIIFESNEPIGHPEKPTIESKSYLDFNPLKRA